jgi:hypothetical protein
VSDDTLSTPKFSFGAAAQPVSSGGLFTPSKSSTETDAASGNLFSRLSDAIDTSATPQPRSGLQFKPVSAGSSGSDARKSTSASVSDRNSTQSTDPGLPASRDSIHTTSRLSQPEPTSHAGRVAGTDATGSRPSVGAPDAKSDLTPVKRPVYTKGPSRAPGHTNAEQFQEYDRDYRLHALNFGLQQKLASLDPRSKDFDNIIRHYVAARDNIGASLGLHVRNLAGMKRKNDEVEDREEQPDRSKRSQGVDAHKSTASSNAHLVSSNTTLQASLSGQNKSAELQKASLPQPSPTTNATEAGGSPPRKHANPFAPREEPAPAASSTTPTKSPPKKPTFEVPKFGGGSGTNFLAAFGQQAKVNADKLEKNLLEKRKAEDFDSDEDDEEEFQKKIEEENRAKRARIDAIAKAGFTPSFGSAPSVKESASQGKGFQPAPTVTGSIPDKKDPKPSAPGFGCSTGFSALADKNGPAGLGRFATTSNAKDSKAPFAGFEATSTASTPFLGFASASKTPASKPFAGFGSTTSSAPFSGFKSTPIVTAQEEAEDDEVDTRKDDGGEDDSGSGNSQADLDADEDGHAGEEEEEAEESLPEDEVAEADGEYHPDEEDESDDSNDLQAAMDRSRRNPNAGKSLFDRIEPNPDREKSSPQANGEKESSRENSPILEPAKNSSFPPAIWGSHIGKSTPEQPAFSTFTPAASAIKPSTTFNFTPAPPSATTSLTPGASIFSGGSTRDGPVPGEGLFGSRPSTPSNAEKNGNLAKSVLTSPAGTDNTWKPGGSISFGNGDKPTSAPTFKFTAASPGGKEKSGSAAQPFGSLFGTSTATSSGTATPSVGFQFGTQPAAPAPGYLGAVSHLAAGSAASSVASSRATSPGLTDNESVATNETEETSDEPQTSLMESRAGEENESTLWEGRSKALMFVNTDAAKGTKHKPNDWNSVGVGMVRVLKDKTNGKTRVVFRVEPSANILFNSHLVASTTYESVGGSKSGAVRGALMHKGSLTRLVFKLKTPEMADELAKILEENKTV